MQHTLAGSLQAFDLSKQPTSEVRAAMPSHRTPLQRAQCELAAYAVRLQRADAARRSPFWPFGTLTEQQMRERAAMQRKAQADQLARWPEALL